MKKLLTAIAIILLWAGFAWGASLSGVSVSGVAVNNDQWYGITWNQSTDAYTRTGATAGYPTGATINDYAALPIQGNMRRCVLQDDGDVAYYLCPTDSTLKEDCSTAANLDGTDGQVMVEIPKFYIRYSYAANVHSWDVSPVLLSGFEAHPAFYKDGAWVDYRYIGAYEGSMYDASASAMCTDATAITNIYTAGDKLCSITGQCPKVNEMRTEYRGMASQRGAGWRQQDYYLTAAVQLLYLTEYADFDSQSMIGTGRSYFGNGSWVIAGVGGCIGRTGYSNSDGNATNATNRVVQLNIAAIDTSQAAYQDYMSYRGIENFYGNVWQWVDGINIGAAGAHDGGNDEAALTDSGESWPVDSLIGATIANTTDGSSGTITDNDGTTITATLSGGVDNNWDTGDAYTISYIVWLCNTEANYADDTYANYDAVYDTSGNRAVLHNASGYAGALEQLTTGFLPADVTGSSATKICDYYEQDTGLRVVIFGATAISTTAVGAFYVYAGINSSYSAVHTGGRLCY